MKSEDNVIQCRAVGVEEPYDEREQQQGSNHELGKALGNRGSEPLPKELDGNPLLLQGFDR